MPGRAVGAVMSWWWRVAISVGALLMGIAVVLVALPTPAAAATPSPTPVIPQPTNYCDAIDSMVASGAMTAEALAEALVSSGGEPAVVAAVLGCSAGTGPALSDSQQRAVVCKIAIGLNLAEKYSETVDLVTAYAASTPGDDKPCEHPLSVAQKKVAEAEKPAETTPKGLGDLWTKFTKEVVAPLTPIVTFVLASTLVILALARVLVFLPFLRDPRGGWGRRGLRVAAWWVGIPLAVISSAAVALLGIWYMRGDGPSGKPIATSYPDFLPFVTAVLREPGPRWIISGLFMLAAIVVLTFAFASQMRVTLSVKVKDDGTGLDSTRVMAAIDGMAGAVNRGIEFPVGTDLTTAATAVTELSTNKLVATAQAIIKGIFGTTPWRLAIENEGADAASISISRNGALIAAKRVRLVKGEPLADLTEPPPSDRLAALVAGHLVEALRTRYAADFDPNLHGATRGDSIALHYVATNSLSSTPESRASALPLLEKAIASDAANRSVWATKHNFIYRDPASHKAGSSVSHLEYRAFLEHAIADELRRIGTDQPQSDNHALWFELPPAARKVPPAVLRGDGLLLRLTQAHGAAAANAKAAGAPDLGPSSLWKLRIYLLDRKRDSNERPTDAAMRRQYLLIDSFRRSTSLTDGAGVAAVPDVLWRDTFADELAAWNDAGSASGQSLTHRFAREKAALDVRSPAENDAMVAYALACYRAVVWLGRTDVPESTLPGAPSNDAVVRASITELLTIGATSDAVRAWFRIDPEMDTVRGTQLVPPAMTPIRAEKTPEKPEEDECMWVLIKRLLVRLAK